VLLVHGFVGRPGHFRGMQRALHAAGRPTVAVDLKWAFRGVASYGPPLADAIEAFDQVDIVAHSMGGVVARKVLAERPDLRARVQQVITLGTPHHGTESARGLPPDFPRDIGDLQPDSPFLQQLPSLRELLPDRPLLAVAAQWDVVVFPLHRALPADMRQLVLPHLGHNGLLTEPEAYAAVLDQLGSSSAG